MERKKEALKTISAIMCIVTGGLAFVCAIIGWIARSDNWGNTPAPTNFVIGSVLVVGGALCLVLFGCLLATRVLDQTWVYFILVAAAAACTISFANTTGHYLAVGTIALLLTTFISSKTQPKQDEPQTNTPKKSNKTTNAE